ncbi:flagellar hook-length control protein FliK [Vibrio aestuarianus]|uniref:Flagellar hook-length control protein fliK n=2 Tax=Vibrio aestuarianus TaxID=28171 RepID=A0ABN8TPK3_9VIBR|nr:flagellar hook-length control protein FliK [Vibrio aestuarianus]MDE1227598.1 flagellar hook-length control protein FliK [Vibrio aestuarianus]MDE1256069.1 flagellar hook-length control protein FliK [Vibrio aestuarianus]MDE1272280.1 flagellar hook-length control protein FliK [Vibrio aestuarianus]MDE1293162.1 flagellar hook-length control protein FliK [Vibrio aestuarianus]MDE1306822.1 flagellar hook-length control protein FliK [Vibrio aestuarianus]
MDMNVNITTPSDTSKIASVSKASTDSASEGSESKGFFEKLTTIITGSDAKEAAEAKSTEVKASIPAEVKAAPLDSKNANVEQAAGKSSDALLAQKLDGEEAEILLGADKHSKSKLSSESDDVAIQQKTAQVMSDGDEILGRLNSANQVLTDANGKTLPQEKSQPLEGAEIQRADSIDPKMVAVIPSSPLNENMHANSVINDAQFSQADNLQFQQGEPKADIPASVQKFIQQPTSELAPTEQELSQRVPLTARGEGEEQSDEASGQHAIGAQALIAASAVDTQQVVQPQSAVTPTNALEVQGETVIGSDAVLAAAIPWAGAAAIEGQVITLDGSDNAATLKGKSQATPVANSVHQALTQQQSQTMQASVAADKAALANSALSAAGSDVTNAQVQQMINTMPMQTAITPEQPISQAALKAALGAKALAGLGDSGTAQEHKDSSLAHQISTAAGQQGITSAQNRAENLQQAAPQPPLHLNKEMASDQMAERVQMMMSKNLKHVDILLDPPELGRLQIRMNMNGDGATVHFTVANHQARDAIEQSMPRLREMLAQQGVQLGDTSVQQQNTGQQQSRYASSGDGQPGQLSRNENYLGEENLDTDVKLDLNVASKRDGISYYA